MKRTLLIVIVCGILGLGLGYFMFGKVGNSYISLETLFTSGQNVVARVARSIGQVDVARRNIFLSGAGGAVVAGRR